MGVLVSALYHWGVKMMALVIIFVSAGEKNVLGLIAKSSLSLFIIFLPNT